MNRWPLQLKKVLLLGALGSLTACTSTRPLSPAQAATLAPLAPRRVLVLAELGNRTSRQAIEDELVRQLGVAGVEAVPGYRVAPDSIELSGSRLGQALAGSKTDSALVCHWLSVEQRLHRRAVLPTGLRSDSRVDQIAYAQTRLLDGRTQQTLWSTRTRTEQPGGFRDSAPSFAKAVVEALLDDGALASLP